VTVTAIPPTAQAAEPAAPEKKSRKKLLVLVLVVVAAAGAAYWFLLKPAPSGEEPPPEPGPMVALDPIQVNLSGGHYLRIGIALQFVASSHDTDGSKALDAVIDLFSGRSMEELQTKDQRHALKEELTEHVSEAYHHEVYEVYFTDFVTQ